MTLDATLYLPAGVRGPVPAVLLAHGFGGSKADLADDARALAQQGYVVLAYTARGFGASGGLVHLDAPDYEVADARQMLDLLARRREVLQDGPGDPRVGVAGGSYGGALTLLLAGLDPRVDAIAPQITWNDLRPGAVPPVHGRAGRAASPAEVAPAGGPGVFKRSVGRLFFGPGGAGGAARRRRRDRARGRPAGPGCGRFAPDVCARLPAGGGRAGRATPQALALLRASSPATVLDRIKAPTLLVQGEARLAVPAVGGRRQRPRASPRTAPRSRSSGTAAGTTAASTRPTGCAGSCSTGSAAT